MRWWLMMMMVALALSGAGLTQIVSPAFANVPLSQKERASLAHAIGKQAKSNLREFYASREFRPLWLAPDGQLNSAALALLRHFETVEFDAIDASEIKLDSLLRALRRARNGDSSKLARAELNLSAAFGRYVREMGRAPRVALQYEDQTLAPSIATPVEALEEAAKRNSLLRYIESMGWMHPLYAPMRSALFDRAYSDSERRIIWQNLSRIRALPPKRVGKYILVDAASARLWMYEDGKPVDSMRVVVGRPESPTPMMAGFVRHAIVNPYWNVPTDLVQKTIAPNVLQKGSEYLKSRGYQVLSNWSTDAVVVEPKLIDWKAVAAGTSQVRVRQLPSGSNFMGKVKYEFPNPQGIYLHDTPDKALLGEHVRQLSNGCIRLQDADRLGRWLMQMKLPRHGRKPEQRINLPQLVPVYITYLTAMPVGGKVSFQADVYEWDIVHPLVRAD